MKKKLLVLIIALFFLTGCQSKNDKLFIEQENKVKEEIKEVDNVTQDKIREKYLYLKNNYESIKSASKEELIYSAKYIQTVGLNHENEMVKFADSILIYIKDNKKENYEKLEIAFKNVETQEEKLITDLYNAYMVDHLVKGIIEKKQETIMADVKDKNILTSKKIKEGLSYIEKNIENPFKNQEILENLVYYGLFFENVPKSASIQKIGKNTINYLKSLDIELLETIQNQLTKLNKDKEIKKILGK